jgi:hypothetical protein
MNELKNRGVEDMLIAVVDGSKAFLKRSPRFSRGRQCTFALAYYFEQIVRRGLVGAGLRSP